MTMTEFMLAQLAQLIFTSSKRRGKRPKFRDFMFSVQLHKSRKREELEKDPTSVDRDLKAVFSAFAKRAKDE